MTGLPREIPDPLVSQSSCRSPRKFKPSDEHFFLVDVSKQCLQRTPVCLLPFDLYRVSNPNSSPNPNLTHTGPLQIAGLLGICPPITPLSRQSWAITINKWHFQPIYVHLDKNKVSMYFSLQTMHNEAILFPRMILCRKLLK